MQATKTRGRPRQFDIDEVLDQALRVFWRQGFQAASVSELTEATGLNKPSLYGAFGDKEALYLKCLERYASRLEALQLQQLEGAKDARSSVENLLYTMVDLQCSQTLPGGCFVVNGTADCGNPGTPMAVEAALRKAASGPKARLLARLMRADREGELPAGTDANRLASLFSAIIDATALMCKAGTPRKQIDEVLEGAMLAWPEPVKARPTSNRRAT